MNNPLFVADSSRERRRRVVEDTVEKDFMWALDQLGLVNRHFYDRFGGVPDRYIVGGNWLEFKSVAYVKHVNVFNHLEVDQRRHLAMFHNGGDRSFAVVMLCDPDTRRLLICPWPSVERATKVTAAWANNHLPEINDKQDMKLAVSAWFGKHHGERNSRYDDVSF